MAFNLRASRLGIALALAGCLAPGSLNAHDAALPGALGAALALGYLLGRRNPAGSAAQTQLRALEARNAELERACQQAAARIEIKAQFLAQMSHELRTPMNGIAGFVELLSKTPLAEDQREKLCLIERSAQRLLATINEILDLAKIEASQPTPKTEWFPLRPCLEDTVGLLTPQAKVPILLSVEPEIPALLRGDPIRLQQVLTNLLGNAIKFTAAGRIALRVRRAPGRPGTLLFSVSDTGPGIAGQYQDRLFAPFVQLAERAPNGERGTGLGLDIARSLAESLGGRIGVVSKPGKGSTFWFTHPLADPPPPAARPLGGRIALVDPDPLSRKALCHQLASLGAEVHGFASFAAFLGGYRPDTHGPKAIFNLSGQEQNAPARCIERTKTLGAYPIVILPHSNRRIREYAQEPGLTYLWHPVRSELLVKLLTAAVPPTPSTLPTPPMPTPSLRDRTVLVIDDNEINRLLLKAQLAQWGAEVVEATDGAGALGQLRARPFGLVFLDLRLPDIHGADVLRALLLGDISPNHATPFIAMSAHAEAEQQVSLAQAGFGEFLLKPVLEAQLRQVLAKYPHLHSAPAAPPSQVAAHVAGLLARSAHSHPLAHTLARKLVEEVQQLAGDIQEALIDGDFIAAREAVHKLNGSAAFCGLDGIRESAAALEQALLDATPPETLGRRVRQLEQDIAQFLALREPLLAALGAADPARPKARMEVA